MPLTNRVDPFGAIFATPHKGDFMGNRGGRLHDDNKTLTRRRWVSRQWITCVLSFNGRKRELMAPNRYTELFFLDEATAFAAGHRPCYECRRDAFNQFKAVWSGDSGKAADIDRVLHDERLGRPRHQAKPADLPIGAMVEFDGAAWLKTDRALRRWTSAGYAEIAPIPDAAVAVLTPLSLVAVLGEGYPIALHASAISANPPPAAPS
ncbi:hypothetical protein BH11PSE2_BH11PSE2_05580 [soil metagenome]